MESSPYIAPRSVIRAEPDRKQTVGYRNSLLAVFWIVAILGLPITTLYEQFLTQSNPEFRLGWIHLIAPVFACIIPVTFITSWPRKLGLIISTSIICGIAEIMAVFVDIMFFTGLSGIQ